MKSDNISIAGRSSAAYLLCGFEWKYLDLIFHLITDFSIQIFFFLYTNKEIKKKKIQSLSIIFNSSCYIQSYPMHFTMRIEDSEARACQVRQRTWFSEDPGYPIGKTEIPAMANKLQELNMNEFLNIFKYICNFIN